MAADSDLVGGNAEEMNLFMEMIDIFSVGKISYGGTFLFLGWKRDGGDEIIKILICYYLNWIEKKTISDKWCHQCAFSPTAKEVSDCRTLA